MLLLAIAKSRNENYLSKTTPLKLNPVLCHNGYTKKRER